MAVTKTLAIHCAEMNEFVSNIHQINFKDNPQSGIWKPSFMYNSSKGDSASPLKSKRFQPRFDENQKLLLVLDVSTTTFEPFRQEKWKNMNLERLMQCT